MIYRRRIVTEGADEDRLIREFSDKLVTAYEANYPEKAKKAKETGKKIDPKQVIAEIAKYDPTPNKEFTWWLAVNYANGINLSHPPASMTPKQISKMQAWNGGITHLEDMEGVVQNLIKFKALLRKPKLDPPLPIRDINQIRGSSTLFSIVKEYRLDPMDVSSLTAEDRKLMTAGEAHLLYDDQDIRVIEIISPKAAMYYGQGTNWCTRFSDNAQGYTSRGPLYYIVVKNSGRDERYQFSYKDNQWMDINDRHISVKSLADRFPVLWKVFQPIAEKHDSFILNENPSERVMINAVTKDAKAITEIKNPPEAVQLAHIRAGHSIQLIKNPTMPTILASLAHSGFDISYFKKPTEEMCLVAVHNTPASICMIAPEYQTPKVQLAAVKDDPTSIEWVNGKLRPAVQQYILENIWDAFTNPENEDKFDSDIWKKGVKAANSTAYAKRKKAKANVE